MINRVILLGHVEYDPQVNILPNGGRVANFSLLTQERWKDSRTGEERSRYERHKIAVFVDKHVDMIEQNVKSGTVLYMEGVLESRSWVDKQGLPYSSVDVVVRPAKGMVLLMDDMEPPTTH